LVALVAGPAQVFLRPKDLLARVFYQLFNLHSARLYLSSAFVNASRGAERELRGGVVALSPVTIGTWRPRS
jgi:hypothetical protein